MRPVLILTAGFGEGHNAAARNLRDALVAGNPGARVEMRDIFADAYGPLNRLTQRAYATVISRFPGIWQRVYEGMHDTDLVARRIGIFGRAARILRRTLAEMAPAAVVTTYPGYNHLLDHLFGGPSAPRPFQTFTVVTDSITINSVWHTGHSDWFVVANADTATVMAEAGVDTSKIRDLGFPVPPIFAQLRESSPRPPLADRPPRALYMVNAGRQHATGIVSALLSIGGLELDVTVGRDGALGDELKALASHMDRPIGIHGWTPEMPRLMARSDILVGKAGGATVQETLAAGTPILITQIVPGQEEGNALFVSRNAAGAIASGGPSEIRSTLEIALADGANTLCAWQRNALAIGRPDASRAVAEFVASRC